MIPKHNIFIKRKRFDVIVIDTDSPIRVSDGDVDGEIVVKCVVVGEIESSKGCIGDGEVDDIRTDDEPEEEAEDYGDDKDCG